MHVLAIAAGLGGNGSVQTLLCQKRGRQRDIPLATSDRPQALRLLKRLAKPLRSWGSTRPDREVTPGWAPLVEEAMVQDVFTVAPDTPIGEVIETMIEKKVGSAIVREGERVVGVFTTIDALQALHRLLERPSLS